MKTIHDENTNFDDMLLDLPFEDIDFDEEEIYSELADMENFDDLIDQGTCFECGDPNGYLSIDPYANIYGEGANVYLCRHCSNDHLYS